MCFCVSASSGTISLSNIDLRVGVHQDKDEDRFTCNAVDCLSSSICSRLAVVHISGHVTLWVTRESRTQCWSHQSRHSKILKVGGVVGVATLIREGFSSLA